MLNNYGIIMRWGILVESCEHSIKSLYYVNVELDQKSDSAFQENLVAVNCITAVDIFYRHMKFNVHHFSRNTIENTVLNLSTY
jgi:hypothetical protein